MDQKANSFVVDETDRGRGFYNVAYIRDAEPHKRAGKGSPSVENQLVSKRHYNTVNVNDKAIQTDLKSDRQELDNGKKKVGKNKRDRPSAAGDTSKQRENSVAAIKDACGTATNYSLGLFVRVLLIAGNVLAVWRTVVETGDQRHWMWVPICSVVMVIEYSIVIFKKKGLEWMWWSPCFLVYLGTTLPLVWQMQLKQRENYVASLNSVDDAIRYANPDGPQSLVDNTSFVNTSTTVAGDVSTESSIVQLQDISWRTIINISSDTWVIVVNESLVYLIIFSRWLLPRGEISRDFLADMLLEFLAIASDIMELLALFDEGRVREDIMLNYWILTAWSISFIQFIPVLLHKRKYRRIQTLKTGCLRKNCGNNFTEVLATFMSIVLQDGSFLVLRLYIMIRLNFVTYSLTFFVMKNLLSLLLLFYRLVILFHNLPCCCGKKYQLTNSLSRTRTVTYEV